MLNIDYKILGRILATRLLPNMNTLVHEDHAGFIATRNTAGTVFTILEANREGRETAGIFAVDIEKAFDSLEWGLLYEVMMSMGLGRDL